MCNLCGFLKINTDVAIDSKSSLMGMGATIQVPKIDKIVVNCGIGDAVQGLDAAMNAVALITGPRHVKTPSRSGKVDHLVLLSLSEEM
ncbi:hypothetical protein Q3G72_013431 [Acer saccharum]|nr:hypothetical protein Q3G72_013431 [Acer saccharum]